MPHVTDLEYICLHGELEGRITAIYGLHLSLPYSVQLQMFMFPANEISIRLRVIFGLYYTHTYQAHVHVHCLRLKPG